MISLIKTKLEGDLGTQSYLAMPKHEFYQQIPQKGSNAYFSADGVWELKKLQYYLFVLRILLVTSFRDIAQQIYFVGINFHFSTMVVTPE